MSSLKSAALAAIVVGTIAIGASYLSPFVFDRPAPWAPGVFIFGTANIMVGTMTLGAVRERGLGRLAVPFAFTWVLLVGGFAAVLALPAGTVQELWLGLPPSAAIIVYGIGIVPVLVLPLAYALTFDSVTLRPGDVERVREARRAMESGE